MKKTILILAVLLSFTLSACNNESSKDIVDDKEKEQEQIEDVVTLTSYETAYLNHLEALNDKEMLLYNMNLNAFTLFNFTGDVDVKVLLDMVNEKTKISFDITNQEPQFYDAFTYIKDGSFFETGNIDSKWIAEEIVKANHIYETIIVDYSDLFTEYEESTENGKTTFMLEISMGELMNFDPTVWGRSVNRNLDTMVSIKVVFNNETKLMEEVVVDLTNYAIDRNEETSSVIFNDEVTHESLYYVLTLTLEDTLELDEFELPSITDVDTGQNERYLLPLSDYLVLEDIVEGKINYLGDEDYYQFEITEFSRVKFDVSYVLTTNSISYIIWNSDSETVFSKNTKDTFESDELELPVGIYTIKVAHAPNFLSNIIPSTDKYTFKVTLVDNTN